MITAAHIKSLLELQKATNVAYFGEEWRRYWTEVAVVNSIYREWAEFLDETTFDWKIYGSERSWNQVDAIYELVDVVHFMLCRILITDADADQEIIMVNTPIPSKTSMGIGIVTRFFTDFMNHPNCASLTLFISYSCSYLGLDAETYMLAHKRKNDRNRLRAAGGVNYDKSTETPLTLEF